MSVLKTIKKISKKYIFFMGIIIIMLMTGCEKKKPTSWGGEIDYYIPTKEPPETEKPQERYNKSDSVVILENNLDKSTLSVKSINDDQVYILNYNGGTSILSRKGNHILASELEKGELAEVYYVDGTQKLIKVQISEKTWEDNMAYGMTIDGEKKLIAYGGKKYSYDDDIVVISGNHFIDLEEVLDIDELTVRGNDNKIISIVVNKGHGLIKLTDTENFIGGVIEIGSRISKIIEKDMVIPVPEGTYKLSVSNNGKGGEKDITIERNDVLNMSLIPFKGQVDRYGLVKFIIANEGAVLTIDGKIQDYTTEVQLMYGTHNIVISAPGFSDYERKITVDSSYTTITIDLDGQSDKEDATTSDTPVVDVEMETAIDSEHKIYLSLPTDDVSVYFDGLYKGKGPVSFEKITGNHIVILMKSGYKTKIYTLNIPDDDKDYIKVFDGLEKEN